MGADGGSIPRREDLVKLATKEAKPQSENADLQKWLICALDRVALKPPLVCCYRGFIFNKESVVKHLLDKSIPKQFKYIKSLKDVHNINLTPNPSFNPKVERTNDGNVDLAKESPYICPVTGIEVGGKSKFVAIKTCGCVVSERALKECASDICLLCNKSYSPNHVILLNPDEEQLKQIKKRSSKKSESSLDNTNSDNNSNNNNNSVSKAEKRKLVQEVSQSKKQHVLEAK